MLPLIVSTFDYGGVEVRAADCRERFFVSPSAAPSSSTATAAARRRRSACSRASARSSSSAPTEYVPPFDCEADYVVHPEENVHAWCSFTAHAVPRLRALGWDVSIDPRLSVPGGRAAQLADCLDRAGRRRAGDWFSLELGIDVDGPAHQPPAGAARDARAVLGRVGSGLALAHADAPSRAAARQ